AMVTPALLIIPLVHYAGKRAEHPHIKGVLQAVVFSSAGLLWASTVPIAQGAITSPVSVVILIASLCALASRKIESLWVILAAALLQLTAASVGLVTTF